MTLGTSPFPLPATLTTEHVPLYKKRRHELFLTSSPLIKELMKNRSPKKTASPSPTPKAGDWREDASVFAASASTHYETVRQSFLELAATDPRKAVIEWGREVVQAQVVHENMQVV